MTAVAFDTLKFARALRDKAKLSPEQAVGFADATAEAIQADLATKADILAARTDLRETELRLKAKIGEVRADLIQWVFGTVGFQTIIILGAVVTLARASGRAP